MTTSTDMEGQEHETMLALEPRELIFRGVKLGQVSNRVCFSMRRRFGTAVSGSNTA